MGALAVMVVARAVSRARVKKSIQERASRPIMAPADLSNEVLGEAGHPLVNDQGEHDEFENHL